MKTTIDPYGNEVQSTKFGIEFPVRYTLLGRILKALKIIK